MKYFFSFLLLVFCLGVANAQYYSVDGAIVGAKDNQPLPGAGIIMTGKDSTKFAVPTDLNGKFHITGVSNGVYTMKISFVGYKTHRLFVQVSNKSLVLEKIALIEQDKNLKEIQITGQVPTGVQKGDTTEFNASAFKTNPDATSEDLVQKLPGVTIQNGKIQAHGEDVKKVLVDGKPFFGDDPTAALRNLPSEVVEKVQVFDQMSDQSQYSGFDDGNTTKTMNIITRANKRSGNFGKAYIGYGENDRYEVGITANKFQGERRITFLAQTNNTNKLNFSVDDMMGAMGAGGGGGRRGGGGFSGGQGMGSFMSTPKGNTTTHALGFNYSDKWGQKVEASGSYFFNYGDNFTDQNTVREYLISSAQGQIYNETNQTNIINTNQRFNMRVEYKIDSVNSIMFRPRMSYQSNDNGTILLGNTYVSGVLSTLLGNTNNSNGNMVNLGFEVNFRHRFATKGRSFSIELSPSYNKRLGDGDALKSLQNDPSLPNSVPVIANQINNSLRDGWGFSSTLGYTEPIGQKGQVLIQYRYNQTRSVSEKNTFTLNSLTNNYDLVDYLLSNYFDNDYLAHQIGTTYRYAAEKLQVSGGVSVQWAEQNNKQTYPKTTDLNQSIRKYQPEFELKYKPNKTTQLRFNYRLSTQTPSIDKLQNIVDNSNPLFISVGNPDLKQSITHNFSTRFSLLSPEKSKTMMMFVFANFTDNYITNATFNTPKNINSITIFDVVLGSGAQLTRPVNVDGYYNVRSFLTFGFPLKLIKTNVNFNVSGNYTQTPTVINTVKNLAKTQSYGLGVVLSSNISENLDFTLSSSSNYNTVDNSMAATQNNEYYSINSSGRLNWQFLNGFIYTADLRHTYYKSNSGGGADLYNQRYMLLNMSIGHKLFKNKAGEIKLSVYDMLKQNISIDRSYSDAYQEDTRSNVIGRYYMLTFTYNLRMFNQPSRKGERRHEDFRMMREMH